MGHPVISLVTFVCISVAASYAFYRMRIPAGIIIGPIFVLTLLQLVGFHPVIPAYTDTVLISIFGVYFATRMRAVADLRQATLIAPLLVTVIWFIAQTFVSSFVLRQLSDIGTINSYLSVIPGGIAEMNVVTLSYGANVSVINTFHLARLFSIILLVPAVLKIVYKGRIAGTVRTTEEFFPRQRERLDVPKLTAMFAVGAAGSVAFVLLGIPAGGLMGALLFVVLYEALTRVRAAPPKRMFVVVVSVLGGTIGLNTDIEVFRSITQLLVPVVVVTLITLTGAALLALLLHALFGREYLPTLLGVMPGGLAVMMSLAESTTSDLLYVTSLQTIRLVTAVVILPNLLLISGIIVPQ